jgi:hypothetical protein
LLIAVLGLIPALAGCGDDADDARSVVEVSSIADNGVFVCGIWDAGSDKEYGSDDDFQPVGHVRVVLKNRSYNSFVNATEFQPFGDFHVTGVAVEWVPLGGITDTVQLQNLRAFNYTAQYDLMVPKDEQVGFNVMIVPLSMKASPYFANLAGSPRGNGSTTQFSAGARILIEGHDSGDERLVTVEAFAIVEFVGVIIGE